MSFIRPEFLWLLLLVVPLVVLYWGHRRAARGSQAIVVALMQALPLVLLCVALARPIVDRADPSHTTVVVVDTSTSIPDEALPAVWAALRELATRPTPHEVLKLVLFDRHAYEADLEEALVQAAAGSRPWPVNRPAARAPGSALASALGLASALIPHCGRGRVVLFSDGLETSGDALAATHRLAERGLTVEIRSIGATHRQEVILRSVSLPAAARVGETVELQADLASSRVADATLTVENKSGAVEAVAPIELSRGWQQISVSIPLREEGLKEFTVRVESASDALHDNNALPAAVFVAPATRVGVVEVEPDGMTSRALATLVGTAGEVRRLSPDTLSDAGTLDSLDLLVIADTPAEYVPMETQERIRREVSGGMGLLVTGGRSSFGPGGYADTPLAQVLPVRFPQETERRDPSSTLVVIIDTSGSMGGTRVNLAKEIARLAIGHLKPHDKVGIVEFYGSKRWAAPIQPASNAIEIHRALNRLSAGGGTVILPAIEEAYYALLNVHTRTKHVLVLTDGGVETGAFEPVIRKMADHGMTLSTVLVGPGRYSAFLASLAHWGGGRSYVASDRFNLPEIIIKQPRSSLPPPFVERPCRIVAQHRSRIVAEIDLAEAPPIQGFNQTIARPTADVLLRTELGQPLLATWNYGLGAVAVFASQLSGEWAGDLPTWPSYSTLVSNIARWLARPRADDALRLQPVLRPGAVEVQIDNTLARQRGSLAAVQLHVVPSENGARAITLDPLAPDRWNARLADLAPGTYRLAAESSDGRLFGSAAFAVPPDREVWDVGVNEALFTAMKALQPVARRRAAELAEARPRRPRELWPALACAALVFFLLAVLVRRWQPRMPRRIVAFLLFTVIPLSSSSIMAAQEEVEPSLRTASTATAEELLAELEDALRRKSQVRVEAVLEETCRAVTQRDGSLDAALKMMKSMRDSHPLGAKTFASVAAMAGDLDAARSALAAMTEREASPPELLGELARYEELLGHDEAALHALRQALTREEDLSRRFALCVRAALLHYDSGERQRGRESLQAIAMDSSGQPSVMQFCAHLASLFGDYEGAVAFSESAQIAREESHHHLFRGQWLRRAGRWPQAMAEFEQAYQKADSGRDRRYALERLVATARRARQLDALVDRWLGESVLEPDRRHILVQCLRELERPGDALDVLRRCEPAPRQDSGGGPGSWQQEVIIVAIEAGRLREAEAAYRSLLERDPDDLAARSALARLLVMEDRRADAVALFEQGAAAADRADQLLHLAEAAAALALDEVACAAAERARRIDKKAIFPSVMFRAELARRRGDSDTAIELLGKAHEACGDDSGALLRVASAFERYGDKAEALRLLEEVHARTDSEDVLLRMAWLMEENGQAEQALALWRKIWKETEVAARVQQAQERLLDLASRSGKLADLAIEAEEELDAGVVAERTLSLLVEVYTRANDPVSAAEILFEYGKRSGQEVEMLQRLARVHVACEQFARCDAILQRLAELDPANAAEYAQQRAIIAVERNRPQEALQALAELQRLAGDDAAASEFAAGTLDLVGLHAQAAGEYARLLARRPDRIEALLLWGGALRKAGQGDRAIARFQCLLDEATEDDLFAVAVDGLLNLDASPAVLSRALRRVYARIAAEPDKVFLYRLAGDLLEAQGRYAEMRDVLEQAVVVAGERRGPILRELMDGARADGHDDQAIYFGRSVLMLGEELPPQVFLDLGETMIREGQFAQAKRAFDRACVDADGADMKRRVATYYEDAGMPTTADRLIRELLIMQPDNVPLLVRSGTLAEQLGQPERALGQYQRAVALMLQRLPASVAKGPQVQDINDAEPRRREYRAANLDEIAGFLDAATRGLLWAAQHGQSQRHLLGWAANRIRTELEAMDQALDRGTTIKAYPRLEQWASLARRIAFSIRQPEEADRMDAELLQRFPGDTLLAQQIVRERTVWGLHSRAAKLASRVEPKAALPPELRCLSLLEDESLLAAALAEGSLDCRLGAYLVPRLTALGRDDDARRALGTVAPEQVEDFESIAPALLAAATALEDYASFRRWAMVWVERCIRGEDVKGMATSLPACLRATWNLLDTEDRAAIGYRLKRLADSLDQEGRVRVNLLRLRLADDPSVVVLDGDSVLAERAGDAELKPLEAAWLLKKAPAGVRPGLLRRMVAARDEAEVRSFLMVIAGEILFSPGDEFLDTFSELFRAAPQLRLSPERAYSTISQGRWNRNRRAPKLGRRIGDILLEESPFEPAVLTAVAVAYRQAEFTELAEPLMQDALDAILENRLPTFQHERMLRDLVVIARPEILEDLRHNVEQWIEEGTATPNQLFVSASLLDATPMLPDAVAAITEAFKQAPTNRLISRKLIRMLSDQGRVAELAGLMRDHLTKSTIMESYEWRTLATLYLDLFEPETAARAAQKDESPLAPVTEMKIAHLTGDEAKLQLTLSRFLTTNRNRNRFFTPTWPPDPSPGGMRAFFEADRVKPFDRPRLFVGIAGCEFAAEYLAGLLGTTLPGDRIVDGLADGLAEAMVREGAHGQLAHRLSDAAARGALTCQDRHLLLALLKRKPHVMPQNEHPLVRSLLPRFDPADAESLEALARVALERGDECAARSILRWLVARDMITGYSMARLDDRLEHLDQYLALLPKGERDRWRERALDALEPTPLDERRDAIESARIRRWASGPDTSRRREKLDELRFFLQTEADLAAFRETAAALAHVEAAGRQWDEYAEMVDVAFGLAEGRRLDDRFLDCRKVLPTEVGRELRRACVRRVQDVVTGAVEDGTISRPSMVRTLCLLGDWCVRHGLDEEAIGIAERATAAAGVAGECWLWVADLHRSLDDETSAVSMERRLLTEKMLPVVRIPPLLAYVESHEGQQEADALAVRAASYTSHPEVLGRAVRAAQNDGDEAAVEAYRRRMAVWQRAPLPTPPE